MFEEAPCTLATCGKPFIPVSTRQLYCSRKCAEKDRRVRNGAPVRVYPMDAHCLRCGKEYLQLASTHIWCSEKCRRPAKPVEEPARLIPEATAPLKEKPPLTAQQIAHLREFSVPAHRCSPAMRAQLERAGLA